MDKITVKEITDKKTWEAFICKHPEANFLQSWCWGEFHKRLGKTIYRYGFLKGGRLVGVMLSVIEDARRGRYVTVPAGPIIDWWDEDVVNTAFLTMKQIAHDTKSVFIRVRPQLESNDFSQNLFKSYGFVSAPMHLHAELTSQLDITISQEELLGNMRKATRYEVKKAQKLGISIHTSKKTEDIEAFYNLQLDTAKRQKFVPFSLNFLLEQFAEFSAAGYALLYSAFYNNALLAQAFIIFYGQEAVYHYGASTEEGRKFPGAYLIQWEAMCEAKRRGLSRYNFWGVAPEGSVHRFAGLSIFKRGFGGRDIEYLHAQDLIINYPRYGVNYIIEQARKILRRV